MKRSLVNSNVMIDHMIDNIIPHVESVMLAYCHSINSKWYRSDIYQFIYDAIETLIPELRKEVNSIIDFNTILDNVIQTLQKNLKDILPNIEFEKLSNGYYKYSWLDLHRYERFDADKVLEYIKNNKEAANLITKQALNVDLNNFEQKYEISWQDFIDVLLKNPHVIENFHLLVRKYIINLNRDIVLQKSNEINNIRDNDKIISIDEDGNLKDAEGNIINDSFNRLILDFDPRNDEQRERSLVVIREYLSDNKENYEDHIIIGKRGANHGSILNAKKYKSLLDKSIFSWDYNPTISCCYLIGKIAVIDNNRQFFPTVQAVKDLIKNSGKFSKIYIMPYEDPILFRLARKI